MLKTSLSQPGPNLGLTTDLVWMQPGLRLSWMALGLQHLQQQSALLWQHQCPKDLQVQTQARYPLPMDLWHPEVLLRLWVSYPIPMDLRQLAAWQSQRH